MRPFGTRIDKPLIKNAMDKSLENSTDPKDSGSNSGAPAELTTSERFSARPPKYTMADLILSEAVHNDLNTLQSRIQNHALIYHEWDFNSVDPHGRNVAVNFYGPPGTGKTMCAEALAARLGKNVIEINYAEIESKYVGETPKNIVAAFDQAKVHDALLFFDEADSILGRRMTNVTQSADHSVNVTRAVMLKQLDAFPGIVVFATNLAKNFDGAFVRRILQHVFVGPPDEKSRFRLWKKMITIKVPGRNELDFDHLVKSSDGLTGGLIKNVVLLALSTVANRSKESQCIQMDDIASALDSIKRAQREVGTMQEEWIQESPFNLGQFQSTAKSPQTTPLTPN